MTDKKEKENRIFLCHAKEDKGIVDTVYKRLKAEGYRPWLDTQDLLPGQLWDPEIRKAIKQSDFILLFFSKHSVDKRGYVQKEFKLALDVLDEIPEGRIFIIPVRLDDCRIPDRFQHIHYCDLFEDEGIEKILRAIAEEVKNPAVTSNPAAGESKSEAVSPLWETMGRRMVKIKGGILKMKDEKNDNRFTAEIKPFYMDKYPVTQELYQKLMVMNKKPCTFTGSDRPVENATWFEAVYFCNLLSDKLGLKRVYAIAGEKIEADWGANGFRLPTEAEWEYACKAGKSGDKYGKIKNIAWYNGNSGNETHAVGKLAPNPWGLYDMLGNVKEWCWDWYGDYPKGKKLEWRGQENGGDRVCRGGSWASLAADSCRASDRYHCFSPSFRCYDLGFRLARSFFP